MHDTDLICTRVIGIQQSRYINTNEVLTYKLSPVPPSLFDESGDMRIQAKASLKAKLQVEVSTLVTTSIMVSLMVARCYGESSDLPLRLDDCAINCMGITEYHMRAGDIYLII